jgi:signal transduction histidine kinase
MKKIFLLQIFYVISTIILLSLFWKFVLEGLFFSDLNEDLDGKIEYITTILVFSLLALTYPTFKGLSLIRGWESLQKIPVDQLIDLSEVEQKKINSLDSIESILFSELHRRRKAEKKLVSERQKFFNMLDQLPVCFHLQGDDYTVPFANKMFKEHFGDPDKGLCYQVMHNRSKPCEPCPTFKVFDVPETGSSIWTSQAGKTYLTVVTPFEDMDGSKLVMEMGIDITSEKIARDDLMKVLDEEGERTLALEQSNNALKEFSAFAAHDLKEPLRKIMTFSDRLQEVVEVEPGGEGQYYLEGMKRSAERMNALIEDLLELAKIPSHVTNSKMVDLNKIVAEVIVDLEPAFQGCRKNISVQSLPKVEANKTQMYQLFKNLLSNSLKYAKASEVPIVTVGVQVGVTGEYLIFVQDNGIGFDEIYKEKIFKPFERLHGKSQYSGTGIGLAICKKVVESHNGELTVHSQLNVGSTFTVRLPQTHKTLTV